MKKKISKLIIIFFLVLVILALCVPFAVIPAHAVGNTYHVRTDGHDTATGANDTNNETTGAWLTIQHAADTMVAGDTVLVHAGTYNAATYITTSGNAGNPITYQAHNGESVIIDGTGVNLAAAPKALFHLYRVDYIVIDGFTIQDAEKDGAGTGLGAGIYAYNENQTHGNLTFKNLDIHNCYGCGIKPSHYYTTVGLAGNMPNVLIDNCTIHDVDTGADYEEQYSNPAISASTVNGLEIKNTTIYNVGLGYATWTGQEAIVARIGSTNVSIHDNDLSQSRSGIYLQAQAVAMDNIDIYNNKIHDNYDFGIVFGSEGASPQNITDVNIYNNLIYSNADFLGQSTYPDPAGDPTYGNGGFGILSYAFTYTFNLINNTFYSNTKEEIAILGGTPSSCVIRNNILSSTTNDAWSIRYAGYPTGTTVDHNLFYNSGGAWKAGSVSGTDSVTGDPDFVTAGTNFNLQSTSPARDVGSNTGAPVDDYIGTTRPFNTTDDIGAYEYGTPEAPTNVSATDGSFTDKVTVTWTKSAGADNYHVFRGAVDLGAAGDVATYDDAGAGAPTITVGTVTASDGTNLNHVELNSLGATANNGASYTYTVKAYYGAVISSASAGDSGYRGVGSLTRQWQRSSGTLDADYSNIAGATSNPYDDTGAPASGAHRWYKVVLDATGAAQQTSAGNEGWRDAGGGGGGGGGTSFDSTTISINRTLPMVLVAMLIYGLVNVMSKSKLMSLLAAIVMIYVFYALMPGVQEQITAMFGVG